MAYRVLADLVLLAHAAFVAFVVLGGLVALRWPRCAWIHLPSVLWGVIVEYAGIICPLTPLEIFLRSRAGEPGYRGDFLGHYLTALLYPENLTRGRQIVLGVLALGINAIIYGWIAMRRLRGRGLTQRVSP
ncbi:MAG TPA: DUF2784 domain-containing protein [Candidatus Binatia bacterium]|nr:DUF2784 domain-containing protein [Candidatus Binatia bacterium]